MTQFSFEQIAQAIGRCPSTTVPGESLNPDTDALSTVLGQMIHSHKDIIDSSDMDSSALAALERWGVE